MLLAIRVRPLQADLGLETGIGEEPMDRRLPDDDTESDCCWWFPVESDGDKYHIKCSCEWVSVYMLLFIGLIVMVSTVPSSYHYIDYNQYGLLRDNYGDVELTPTYTQGRYFQPLTHSFVTFPSTYNNIRFISSVFDDSGLEFDLYISYYYRIPKVLCDIDIC